MFGSDTIKELMSKQGDTTYNLLGKELKLLRNRAGEGLAEAAGAVEIDPRELANFELGTKRPNQDLLLLLISHFNAADQEAIKLWGLAGYASEPMPEGAILDQSVAKGQPVIFTDVVDVVVNNYGVVMNFMQGGSPSVAPTQVARVGMSREHAKSVLQILKITLEQTEAANLNNPLGKTDNQKLN